ncbi:MAG: hypothetical protein K2P90_03195, partial [Holosporales bacterium]|nr:hypothetical protein [Holosporales bacterium]
MTSRILLSDGLPFVVSRALIHGVGLEQALVLQQIHYWCDPKRNQNHFHGKYWVHNTYKQWQKQFSFWNLKKIQRVFNTLERCELLVSFIQQTNCHKTKFYTINYERLSSMRENPCASSCPENGMTITPKLGGSRDRIGCIDDPKSVLSYKLITETTYKDNPPLTPPSSQGEEEERKSKKDKKEDDPLFQQMVDVWNQHVQSQLYGGSQALLTQQRSQKMAVFLRETTVCDLVAWERYCEKIRASRFLMG